MRKPARTLLPGLLVEWTKTRMPESDLRPGERRMHIEVELPQVPRHRCPSLPVRVCAP